MDEKAAIPGNVYLLSTLFKVRHLCPLGVYHSLLTGMGFIPLFLPWEP